MVADRLVDGDRFTEGPPEPEQDRRDDAGRGVGEASTPRIDSQRVEPSASAPSVRSCGTRMKSSRQIADVIGMIMIVRTSAAGRMPACEGVPEKTGSSPSGVSWIQGSRWSRTHGPKTRIPQRPSTTLGIAASSSTIVAIGAATRRGAISVRNSAIAIESGVAITSAITDVTTVP